MDASTCSGDSTVLSDGVVGDEGREPSEAGVPSKPPILVLKHKNPLKTLFRYIGNKHENMLTCKDANTSNISF